jgi:hypothetical protein
VAAAPVASGSAVAVLSPTGPGNQYLYTVSGLNEVLSAGVYWLGTNNTVRNGSLTAVATVAGVLPGAKQSDGVGNFFDGLEDRAFRIYGRLVPEPSGLMLALFGSIVCGCQKRRCTRSARV